MHVQAIGKLLNYQEFHCEPGSSGPNFFTSGREAHLQFLFRPGCHVLFGTTAKEPCVGNIFTEAKASHLKIPLRICSYMDAALYISPIVHIKLFAKAHAHDRTVVKPTFAEISMSIHHHGPDLTVEHLRIFCFPPSKESTPHQEWSSSVMPITFIKKILCCCGGTFVQKDNKIMQYRRH